MASIAEASSLFEIDMELDTLLEEIEEQVEAEGQASGRPGGPVPAILRGAWREGRPDRALRAHDGGPRTVLPQRGRAACRPRPRRSRQGGTHQKHGALLPAEPRPQEDRRPPIHPARAEEQPGLGERSPTRRRCRSAIAGLRRGLTGVIWETVLSRFSRTNSPRALESSIRRPGRQRRHQGGGSPERSRARCRGAQGIAPACGVISTNQIHAPIQVVATESPDQRHPSRPR